MSEQKESFDNPAFGRGRFQRLIRITHVERVLTCELEDCSHAFKANVYHDGAHITDIKAETVRYPMTTCPGATEPLQAFIGLALGLTPIEYPASVKPKLNCTHLYDLVVLGLTQALAVTHPLLYDVIIPDEQHGPTDITVWVNDQQKLKWQVKDWTITGPDDLVGKPLHKGFMAWVTQYFQTDPVLLNCALAAQKGYLVSHARRLDHAKMQGTPLAADSHMMGVCFSAQPGVIERAQFMGDNYRDFTDSPEQLLAFKE